MIKSKKRLALGLRFWCFSPKKGHLHSLMFKRTGKRDIYGEISAFWGVGFASIRREPRSLQASFYASLLVQQYLHFMFASDSLALFPPLWQKSSPHPSTQPGASQIQRASPPLYLTYDRRSSILCSSSGRPGHKTVKNKVHKQWWNEK